MKLSFECEGKVNSQESIKETDVINIIEKLNPLNYPYLILEGPDKDYIQCMAGDEGFIVELRIYTENDTSKHFVIGIGDLSRTWYTINGKIGPIYVRGHEILQIEDVKKMFTSFLLKNDIPSLYNKRNITKMFK
jgi:hypothetical protein